MPFVNTPEMNLFNDNISYNLHDYKSVVALNKTLLSVALKFDWLDPNKSPPVLRQFLTNLEMVQELLGDLQFALTPCESALPEFEPEAAKLEQAIQELDKALNAWNSNNNIVMDGTPRSKRVSFVGKK